MNLRFQWFALLCFLIEGGMLWSQDDRNELQFSHSSGFYDWNFVLKVTSNNKDTIRYTLDGSVPTPESPVLHDSIPVTILNYLPDRLSKIRTSAQGSIPRANGTKATVFRAVSFYNGQQSSSVYSQTYFVGIKKAEAYPRVPVISLVTEVNYFFHPDSGIYVPGKHFTGHVSTGNYYQKGKNWERPLHIQYFDTTGNLAFE